MVEGRRTWVVVVLSSALCLLVTGTGQAAEAVDSPTDVQMILWDVRQDPPIPSGLVGGHEDPTGDSGVPALPDLPQLPPAIGSLMRAFEIDFITPPEDPTDPSGDEISGVQYSPGPADNVKDKVELSGDDGTPRSNVTFTAPVAPQEAKNASVEETLERRPARSSAPESNAPRGSAPTPSSGGSSPGPDPSIPVQQGRTHAVVETDPFAVFQMVVGGAVGALLLLYLRGLSAGLLAHAAEALRNMARLFIAAPLLVRIKSHQVFKDPKRRLLYSVVKENPGITIKEICKTTGLSRSAVGHHMAFVARTGLVVSESRGRTRHYFPTTEGMDAHARAIHAAAARNERNRDILLYLARHPGSNQKRIAKRFGMHASQAHHVMEALKEVGLVRGQKEGTSVKYFLAEAPTGSPHRDCPSHTNPPATYSVHGLL